MTTDEIIEKAELIYSKLSARRTEWTKWVRYYEANGLKKALQLAKRLSSYPTLRFHEQDAYKSIYNVITKENFNNLSQHELLLIFGYVGQCLMKPLRV